MPFKNVVKREIPRIGRQGRVWLQVVKRSLSNRNQMEIDFGSLYLVAGLIVLIVLATVIH